MEDEGKVVYFAGCFANYYQPETGQALVEILEKNRIMVTVPPQKCCGLPMLANGNWRGAAKNFASLVNSLVQAARAGQEILTTCPSCHKMLQQEGPFFFPSEGASFVSAHLADAEEYLLRLHSRHRLTTAFGAVPLRVFYHNPCHLRIQNITQAPLTLLKMVPGLQLAGVNGTCCGMGGSYGLKKNNFARSRKIARKVWDEVKAAQADILATECGGCSLQIQSGTGIAGTHPLVILNRAYKNG